MTIATYISQLRVQSGDTRRRVHVDWIGDGSTTVFNMPKDCFPVLEQAGTYVVKVAGSAKTESSDFTLDKETGTLIFVVAPSAAAAITCDHSAVHLTDASWMQVIADVTKSLGDDFFKEFVDDTFVTVKNALSLSLVAKQPYCIAVYEFQYRKSTADEWQTVETFANWRFDRENNIIYVGRTTAFPADGELLRVRGLKSYVAPTAVGDTLDVQDRFLTIFEYGSLARYWRRRYRDVIELVTKESTELSRTPLQELIMLADRFDRLYEAEKVKLKPAKPPRVLPRFLESGGRP